MRAKSEAETLGQANFGVSIPDMIFEEARTQQQPKLIEPTERQDIHNVNAGTPREKNFGIPPRSTSHPTHTRTPR
jgi:hypothetical protein